MSKIFSKSHEEEARRLFDQEGLPFPPLPAPLAAELDQFDNSVFSTRKLEFGPYSVESLVRELVCGKGPQEYAVLGFDGHGNNSWAMHYYVVQPGFAFFIQLPWGGAYGDREKSRHRIATSLEWASAIQSAISRNLSKGMIPSGSRLIVLESSFVPSAWTWLPHPVKNPEEVTWHETDNVLNESATSLIEVLSGKATLGEENS